MKVLSFVLQMEDKYDDIDGYSIDATVTLGQVVIWRYNMSPSRHAEELAEVEFAEALGRALDAAGRD